MIEYNKANKVYTSALRKSMPKTEVILWSKLRNKQFFGKVFIRQKMIGDYIVDFCCIKSKLVIEIDGDSHYQDGACEKDKERDIYLSSKGFKVLRFTNLDVLKNLYSVLDVIKNNIH